MLIPQVSNINQPLEITAISSPESLQSSPVPSQDDDQPPVLKKERPLGQSNGAHCSPPTSDEEQGSEDEPSSARHVGLRGAGQPWAVGPGPDVGGFSLTCRQCLSVLSLSSFLSLPTTW